jgi:hypothetical protein
MTSIIEQDNTTAGNAAWIEPHRKTYLEKLVSQGYSVPSRRVYAHTINWFCTEVWKRASEQQEADGALIEAMRQMVLNGIPELVSKRICARYRLGRFIDYLVKAGVVSLPVPPAKRLTAMERLRAEYKHYLHVQRGLSESTVEHCLNFFDRFMAFRFGSALGDLNAITPDDIFSFFRSLTNRQARPFRGKSVPSHLRNLFKFLFWSGKTRCNLASSIPRIAQPRAANLPRYLKPDEVQRLIDAAWSDSAIGRRDHAIMLLLARLGLRAAEVIAIQLEDIDWLAGKILIRGKGKLHDRMPLPDEVGRAPSSNISETVVWENHEPCLSLPESLTRPSRTHRSSTTR